MNLELGKYPNMESVSDELENSRKGTALIKEIIIRVQRGECINSFLESKEELIKDNDALKHQITKLEARVSELEEHMKEHLYQRRLAEINLRDYIAECRCNPIRN